MPNIYKKLVRWVNRITTPTPPQLKVVERPSSKVRLVEWQSSEELVKTALKLNNDPNFRLLLDMLKNECPSNREFADIAAPMEARAIHQAKTEGYLQVLRNIEEAGRLVKPFEFPEPTYETEKIEIET